MKSITKSITKLCDEHNVLTYFFSLAPSTAFCAVIKPSEILESAASRHFQEFRWVLCLAIAIPF